MGSFDKHVHRHHPKTTGITTLENDSFIPAANHDTSLSAAETQHEYDNVDYLQNAHLNYSSGLDDEYFNAIQSFDRVYCHGDGNNEDSNNFEIYDDHQNNFTNTLLYAENLKSEIDRVPYHCDVGHGFCAESFLSDEKLNIHRLLVGPT